MKNIIVVLVEKNTIEVDSSNSVIKSRAKSKIAYTLPQSTIFDNTFRPKFN
jgi:hypothetical protein